MDRDKEELELAKNSFASWRKTRLHGMRIPNELWDKACRCSLLFGTRFVAEELKLNFDRLSFYYKSYKQVNTKSSNNSEAQELDCDKHDDEPARSVTVTKIIAVDKPSDPKSATGPQWELVSPNGFRLTCCGAGGDLLLRTFIESCGSRGVNP